MSTQMTGFTSILSGLQKHKVATDSKIGQIQHDINSLKARFIGASKVDSMVGEAGVEEHSPSDPSAQA